MLVTVYRRGRTWWLRYRTNGQQLRRSLNTDNRKLANDLRAEFEWKRRRGETAPSTPQVSMAQFLE